MKKIQRALAKSPKIIGKRIDEAIKKSTSDISTEAAKNAPVDTGTLRRSIKRDITFRHLFGKIEPRTKYAGWVHYGTRPHTINSPVKLGPKYGNKWVYIKQHPGTKAQPFFTDAVRSEQKTVEDNFEKKLRQGLEEVARQTR